MKHSLLIFALTFSLFIKAQDSTERYVHRGLWRAEATFTPGIFFKGGLTATYLSGALEYYFHENASVRGDGYYFLGYLDDEMPLAVNHSVFAGVSMHIPTKNHLDPYVFFQPGIGLAQSNEDSLMLSIVTANPLISVGTGVNYYFQKVFHVFAELRISHGNHQSDFPTRSLSDLKFSFGLGFNIR